MKAEYINPFIDGVNDLFTTMFNRSVARGKIGLAREAVSGKHIIALIGISGDIKGAVALTMPEKTATSLVGELVGAEFESFDDTVSDGVAEIVNIIAGGAKARFLTGAKTPLQISLPSVVDGSDYSVKYPTNTTWIEVPFTSEFGNFGLRVTLEESDTASKN